jgi:hypothetical protein
VPGPQRMPSAPCAAINDRRRHPALAPAPPGPAREHAVGKGAQPRLDSGMRLDGTCGQQAGSALQESHGSLAYVEIDNAVVLLLDEEVVTRAVAEFDCLPID